MIEMTVTTVEHHPHHVVQSPTALQKREDDTIIGDAISAQGFSCLCRDFLPFFNAVQTQRSSERCWFGFRLPQLTINQSK
jgi:hypothetical protein